MGLNKLGKQSQTQTSVEWDPIWMSKHWALGAVRMPAVEGAVPPPCPALFPCFHSTHSLSTAPDHTLS